MDNLNKIEIAARNKANYLKAKEAFNNKRVDECILFYAADHEVKSKKSEKGRDGIRKFLECFQFLLSSQGPCDLLRLECPA
jgi:hypothetical protein